MNGDPQGLLDDVLAEAAPSDFEWALLDGTLRAVRRRRRRRQWSRGIATTGALIALVLMVWRAWFPTPSIHRIRPSLHLVTSQPLPASMIVQTRRGNIAVVSSSSKMLLVIESGTIKDPFQEIDDDQLLALAGDRPAALVRQGPHQAELIFVRPEDGNGFPVQ